MKQSNKKLFEITEISKSNLERYFLKMTEEEVKVWCKMKREAYGYIEGVGGDRSYDCFAVLID